MAREVQRRRRELQWHSSEPIIMTQKKFREFRPSRNIVMVSMWTVFAVVNALQLKFGVPPTGITHVLDNEVQDTLSWWIIGTATLSLLAATIRHSGASLTVELAAMGLGGTGFLVLTLVTVDTHQSDFYALASFGWAAGLTVGTIARAVQIVRRGY